MFARRPVRPEIVTLFASLVLVLAFNSTLWEHVATITQGTGYALGGAFAVLLWGLFNLALTWLAFRRVLKPVLVALFMISAGVTYFMSQYGVLMDTGMLRNFAQTNATEVRDLLSLRLLGYLLVLGVLPSLWLLRTPIGFRRWPTELVYKLGITSATAVLLLAVGLLNYQGLASMFRNHHELRLMTVPSNYIGAAAGYVSEQFSIAQKPFASLGTDAQRAPQWASHHRPSLTVLVVGESLRADNFGLLGYGRDTTPQLRQQAGVVAFSDVHSCGTETAVSVPCMFSNMGRKHYDATQAYRQEGLLDIIQRAGIEVLWRDNQSGCKGTCNRVKFEDVSNLTDPALCADHECHDEILTRDLQAYIDNLQGDTVLVLHEMGSHGPEYFKRYPAAFEHFTPVCKSNALNQCTRDSIVNAYDNTVRYADHVLSGLIDVLRANQGKVDTGMLYLSDHGESLGEYNLFLHGTPYMIAPEQQKHIPMIAWFSDVYQRAFGLDINCLQQQRDKPWSQDNLFDSMLGLLQVKTEAYRPQLDLFAACHTPT